jgi:hypothetical protein
VEFVQHIKAIILLENGGQRNSQEENEKKTRKIPALRTRASDSGLLNQIFDSVSIICSFFNILKKFFFIKNGDQRNS